MTEKSVMDVKVLEKGSLSKKVAVVVGTRPGIVMFAPIIHELERREVDHFVIHTGQHYSPNMDAQFFNDHQVTAQPPEQPHGACVGAGTGDIALDKVQVFL